MTATLSPSSSPSPTTTIRDRVRVSRVRRWIGDPLARWLGTILRSERFGVLWSRRKDGTWRRTPLGVWRRGEEGFLVALFGETFWAQDIRAGRETELTGRGGRRPVRLEELTGDELIGFWHWYAGAWPGPASRYTNAPKSPREDEARALAATHPVFRGGP